MSRLHIKNNRNGFETALLSENDGFAEMIAKDRVGLPSGGDVGDFLVMLRMEE